MEILEIWLRKLESYVKPSNFMFGVFLSGLCCTGKLIFVFEEEADALLDIPANIRLVALLPAAYFLGDDFKLAKRVPARERTYGGGWGQMR